MSVVQRSDTPAWPVAPDDQRVFTRVPFSHPVHWLSDRGDTGVASIRDVSRSGVCLSLTRFLRPGPVIRIIFDGFEYNGAPVDLQAITVWSRPENGARDRFVAGFKIIQGERDTLGAISGVFYAAIQAYAEAHPSH